MEIYTEKSKNTYKKCIVKGCDNPAFVGKYRDSDLCGECYYMLSNGTITPQRYNYLSQLRREVLILYAIRLADLESMSAFGHAVAVQSYPTVYSVLFNKSTDE